MPSKHAISVQVKSTFLPDESNVDADQYVFAYYVTIINEGTVPAQLISRHWYITEADDEQSEVQGLGVIGEQPWIQPNERYEYQSHTVFKMPNGTMHGTYQMIGEDGVKFDAEIPAFECKMPRVLH